MLKCNHTRIRSCIIRVQAGLALLFLLPWPGYEAKASQTVMEGGGVTNWVIINVSHEKRDWLLLLNYALCKILPGLT